MDFKTRRGICRWVFIVGCLAPTLAMVGIAAVTRSPFNSALTKSHFETDLATSLGLGIHVGRVKTTKDNEVEVENVELVDPETKQWLARFRSAIVTRSAECLSIRICQPEIRWEGSSRLLEVLNEHVMLRHQTAYPEIRVSATTLVLDAEARGESFESIRVSLRGSKEGTELLIAFDRPGTAKDAPVRLRIVRNRQLDPPATGWELHTGDTPLPCSIAGPWLPSLSNLGADCTFLGSVWADRKATGWSGDIIGEFAHVDLRTLVNDQFPHLLSGMAELAIDRGTMDAGHITMARGTLKSPGGVAGQSLIDAARSALGFQVHQRIDNPSRVQYSQLALGFSLDATHLSLQGLVDDQGTVLSDARGSLLSHSETELSPLAVLQLLVPQSKFHIPATRETVSLLRALPLPEITAPATKTTRLDSGPLRFIQ